MSEEKLVTEEKLKNTLNIGKKSHVSRVLSGTKQMEEIMKKFYMSAQIPCKAIPRETPRRARSEKYFPTGSTYEGTWNEFGMSGKGIYNFPENSDGDSVRYKGQFENGELDGDGMLYYPDGSVLTGKWQKGSVVERSLTFADDLEFVEDDWYYCNFPDRRFTVEYDNGICPAGESYIAPEKPPRPIPPGLYDTRDGFYCPRRKMIYKYDNPDSIIRSVKDQAKWIVENCRTAPDEPLGPCPFQYEEWVPPLLEAEEAPAPAARTRHYVKQIMEIEAWNASEKRQSTNPWSKLRFFRKTMESIHPSRPSCFIHPSTSSKAYKYSTWSIDSNAGSTAMPDQVAKAGKKESVARESVDSSKLKEFRHRYRSVIYRDILKGTVDVDVSQIAGIGPLDSRKDMNDELEVEVKPLLNW